MVQYYQSTSRMLMMDCIIYRRNNRHIEAEMFYEWAKISARLMRECENATR